MEKKGIKFYIRLFLATFYLSAFTFGGGFVIIGLMKKKFVDNLKWIDEKEMVDFTVIAQSSPGAVAVNASLLLGFRVAGPLGALTTIFGTILPPLIIISVISLFYTAFRDNVIVNNVLLGMQAGVAAVICDVVISMGLGIVKQKEWVLIGLMALVFTLTFFFSVNVIYIIIGCAVIGLIYTSYKVRKGV